MPKKQLLSQDFPKKNSTFHPVIDFRKVNELTVPDHFLLPVLSDLLQSVGSGNTVVTSFDFKAGFWHTPLESKSRLYHCRHFATNHSVKEGGSGLAQSVH